MLELAAREADIIGIMSSPIRDGAIDPDPGARGEARMAEQVGWIRQAAGPHFDTLDLSVVASPMTVSAVLASSPKGAVARRPSRRSARYASGADWNDRRNQHRRVCPTRSPWSVLSHLG
jgi:hypothetical protein